MVGEKLVLLILVSKFNMIFICIIEMPYNENSPVLAVTDQYRYNNSYLTPYMHGVCAWERGLFCKHVLMSL